MPKICIRQYENLLFEGETKSTKGLALETYDDTSADWSSGRSRARFVVNCPNGDVIAVSSYIGKGHSEAEAIINLCTRPVYLNIEYDPKNEVVVDLMARSLGGE